jgi:5-methylcytosine-specific restriction endonuclease McrA
VGLAKQFRDGVAIVAKKTKTTKPLPISNLKWLHNSGKLWLNPTYQREAVWTRSQKQLLVDSILRGIDIPKLYFREVETAEWELEVVDGQQRLRSLFEFMDDSYKLSSDADQIDGHEIADQKYSTLHTDLQMLFQNVPLDVVQMNSAYTDDDIEEIFLRLQNGTPLNAPEKRRAIPGEMRKVVAQISRHKAFKLCGFTDKRYAYEDATAKILHLMLHGTITDIRPASIKRTYEVNRSITADHRDVKRTKQGLNFIANAFKNSHSPQLRKYAIITLGYLVPEMLDEYDLSKYQSEFAASYLDFEAIRVANEELPEEKQDSALAAYTNAARSDSIPDMRYRHEHLKSMLIRRIPTLALKDPTRDFTNEQRLAIYRIGGGKCAECRTVCEESDFHADHVTPHSRGGQTTVANGQVLCSKHNLTKGDRE